MFFKQHLLHVFVLIFCFSSPALAVDLESDREKVVSPRSKKFYKSNVARQYVSFGGRYATDQNSKETSVTSRYFYQSQNFVNEFNFSNESNYANLGTAKGKTYLVKKSELYDASISSKARIFDTQNYGVFYHRTVYDDMSKFYYDLQTAVGFGRIFLNDKIEFDTSIGYRDIKTYGYKVNIVPSLRVNFKLTDKLTFNQRGYLFADHETVDSELKTSLIYRLGSKLSLELRNTFEQRTYEDDTSRQKVNEVNKIFTIGLIFDLS